MEQKFILAGLYAGVALGAMAPTAMAQVATGSPAPAATAAQAPDTAIGDIIVTAQKRSQSVNTVPMSIITATGEQLRQAGINEVSDLPKITPGLTYGEGLTGTPVYTLRGVGYNDIALSARPAVTVYLDEAPIAFAMETKGASLDLERVEVLKGPQGTLFGNNSTGGAIDFIAAKPTRYLTAGGSLTYARFNEIDVNGYISGPLTDTLSVRLAAEHRGSDAWQYSYTRNDKLGRQDFTNVRGSALWQPTSDLRVQLTVNRWIDRSETEAAQVTEVREEYPGGLAATGLVGYPLAPANDRAADWDPGANYTQNNRFFQTIGRIDYNLSSALTLTSLTTYTRYQQFLPVDFDGTDLNDLSATSTGSIASISQEARIAAKFDKFNIILGGVYAHDRVQENYNVITHGSSIAYGLSEATGLPRVTSFDTIKDEHIRSYAVFGNVEYQITDKLTARVGGRYTETKNHFEGCTADPGDGKTAATFSVLFDTPIGAGQCVSLSATTGKSGLVVTDLNENNESWRVGLQYQLAPRSMIYANISKGYKAGGFPSLVATVAPGLDPARQESVLSYEAGFKLSLIDHVLQLTGAAFYYDYRNKQVTGTILDPIFGAIQKLINVPKSNVKGVELQAIASPIRGLTLNAAGSYLKSKVLDNFTTFDAFGTPNVNFGGTELPFAPDWQGSGSARYSWAIKANTNAFLGSNIRYQSRSYSDLGQLDATRIRAYAVTDVQAGLESPDNRWRAYIWGRNIFNTYYWYNTNRGVDTLLRFAGRPATYGATVEFTFK